MDLPLHETLIQLGLTEGEARVYLALLTSGTSTITPLVEKAKVSSSKIYFILDKLMDKGFVHMIKRDNTKYFTSTDPRRLIDYLDEKKEYLEQQKRNVKTILPLLYAQQKIDNSLPVELGRGKKGFEAAYKEIFETCTLDDAYLGLGGIRASFKMQYYWFTHNQRLAQKGIVQERIYEHDAWYTKDPKIHRRKERRLFYPSVLPKKYKDLPTILTVGSRTLISDLDEQGEVFTLLIRNRNLSKSLQKLLRILQDVASAPVGFSKKPKSS